ncbi:ankyrin repeat domain-containing protein [Chitinophaga varians]|uniref:Ankyrin repeat domain-containing protein n=1 Tax=Chitinophaga varians TaxID=2202339 RepID=A0A847RR49_9BACT|nr:ankyrin repeat domain-containing protein [Chitinophaga varians]NLR68150.1 ankyrin repeat domain-containing protein [Chitinophaga varians]
MRSCHFILSLILSMTIAMTGCTQDKQTPAPSGGNGSLLLKAAAVNDTAVIRQLLEGKADIAARDNKQRTALMLATYNHHTAAAALLIAAGADVNAQDDILNSPFLYAGAEGYSDILQLCLKAGANYKIYNRYGGTALIPACERGHVEVVRTLLQDKTFPIDHVNRLGWTGLLEAIILSNGGPAHIQIVQMLVDAGCNVNLADKDGVTPLAHARQRGFKEIAGILERTGAK